MLEVKRFDQPHGRSVRLERTGPLGTIVSLVLNAPLGGGLFLRGARWSSAWHRARHEPTDSLGVDLTREGAETLHALLGELLSEDPDPFMEVEDDKG